MRTLLLALLVCGACAIDEASPVGPSNDDAGTPVPTRDVVPGGYLWDVTTDGHLVYRQWSGQGLELWAHHVATGESTRLAAIDRDTFIVISGGVVAWWSGPDAAMSYWSAASGVRSRVGGGIGYYWVVGSRNGQYVAYVTGCDEDANCEIAFGPTAAPALLIGRPETIPLKFPYGAVGRMSDDGELLLVTRTAEEMPQLRHVRDGVVSLTERPDLSSIEVDDPMTHALVWGSTSSALYDLGREELIELGDQPRSVELAGDGYQSSAFYLVDDRIGIQRVRFATHERTTIATDIAVHAMSAGRGNDLFVMDKQDQLWLLDLRRDTKHVVVSDGTYVQSTESGAWLAHSKYSGDQRYPVHSSTTSVYTVSALDRDGTPVQSLTNSLLVAPRANMTAGDNLVVWRNPGCPHCGDLDYELWYMSPAHGTQGRIARGSSLEAWPKSSHLSSVARPVGHEVFYTEPTENGAILRGATLP